jgi:hypothetical protein
MQLRRAHRSASAAAAAVALLCVLASCSPSSPPTQTQPPTTAAPTTAAAPTASTAPAAACADVAELKSSLEALTKVKPAEDGVLAVKTAIDNVKANLAPAEASASDVLKPSVEQVKTAFADLQKAASGLTRDNLREKAPDISAAIEQVRTATAALSSTLTESCPGG